MKSLPRRFYAFIWAAAVALIGWGSHTFLHQGITEIISAIAIATAAPLFGMVFFDFKAFNRAASEAGNLILGRLGHRSFGSGSLCRPHGL